MDSQSNINNNIGSSQASSSCHQHQNILNIHWFRNDLRLHDNPALCHTIQLASSSGAEGGGILPIFIFDTTRIYGSDIKSSNNTDVDPYSSCGKCGPRRAQFILESVADLRCNLERCGGGLLVGVGKPEVILGKIAAKAAATAETDIVVNVVCQEEVCSEELAVNDAVRSELLLTNGYSSVGNLKTIWGSTLYDPSTLPFDDGGGVENIPDTFSPFRKEVEKCCKIDIPLDVPSDDQLKLPPLSSNYNIHSIALEKESSDGGCCCHCSLDYMPTLADLGYNTHDIESMSSGVDPRSSLPRGYRGGETFALSRVRDYIWESDSLKAYFDTRNGMIGVNYSTKFAPWLACGCVSPRYIARECVRYEVMRVKNKSTYWVVFELLVRDYFKFFAKKHGNAIFYPSGTSGKQRKWDKLPMALKSWKDGMTGFPLVDANMRELKATGFMSNRGRQNVCSFLAIDLNIDWRQGAEYFEESLLDYDVTSNWVNWANGAAVTGGRLNRFNIVKQSKTYDKNGEYVRLWCPELHAVPNELIHEPWRMSETLMKECGVILGDDYPHPIIDPPIRPKGVDGVGRGQRRKQGKGQGSTNNNNPNSEKESMKSLKTGSYQFNDSI